MGFPATTGATFIDYLVTDRVVAPPRLKGCYSEHLVYMPHCYFVNDYKRCHQDVLDPASLPSRSDFGLPEDKFIFSCSNQVGTRCLRRRPPPRGQRAPLACSERAGRKRLPPAPAAHEGPAGTK